MFDSTSEIRILVDSDWSILTTILYSCLPSHRLQWRHRTKQANCCHWLEECIQTTCFCYVHRVPVGGILEGASVYAAWMEFKAEPENSWTAEINISGGAMRRLRGEMIYLNFPLNGTGRIHGYD